MPDFIQQFLQHATAQGSRSTAVSPNGWIVATLLAGLAGAITAGAPAWLLITLATFTGVAVVNYLVSYWYFALTAPDALRSERFTLTKLAIERSARGDNLVGFDESVIDPTPKLVSPPASEVGQ